MIGGIWHRGLGCLAKMITRIVRYAQLPIYIFSISLHYDIKDIQ